MRCNNIAVFPIHIAEPIRRYATCRIVCRYCRCVLKALGIISGYSRWCRSIGCCHRHVLQFETANVVALKSHKPRRVVVALHIGSCAVYYGCRGTLCPYACSSVCRPLTIDYHIAYKVHGSGDIIRTAGHTDYYGTFGCAAGGHGEGFGEGFYRLGGGAVVAVVA